MATANDIALPGLLGRRICISYTLHGFTFEHSGLVIGVISALPGSRCTAEFLLDQDDGDCCFYDPAEVTIHAIE